VDPLQGFSSFGGGADSMKQDDSQVAGPKAHLGVARNATMPAASDAGCAARAGTAVPPGAYLDSDLTPWPWEN
jgi:hypothetical protein